LNNLIALEIRLSLNTSQVQFRVLYIILGDYSSRNRIFFLILRGRKASFFWICPSVLGLSKWDKYLLTCRRVTESKCTGLHMQWLLQNFLYRGGDLLGKGVGELVLKLSLHGSSQFLLKLIHIFVVAWWGLIQMGVKGSFKPPLGVTTLQKHGSMTALYTAAHTS